MKPGPLFTLFLVAMAMILSCKGDANSPGMDRPSTDQAAVRVAEGIVYDVEIINPNKDDPWMDETLAGLEREELINHIFNGIYDNSLEAFDIFEESRISARKIRSMEENGEFSREEIGKIQFTEAWYYDTLNHSMSKRVVEISLGLQNFGQDGYLRGYYPLFKVKLP